MVGSAKVYQYNGYATDETEQQTAAAGFSLYELAQGRAHTSWHKMFANLREIINASCMSMHSDHLRRNSKMHTTSKGLASSAT